MIKKGIKINCSDEDRKKVFELVRSRTDEFRIVERAKIIASLLEGHGVVETGRKLGVRANTVTDWHKRFNAEGIQGLYDRVRSGKPAKYDKEFRNRLLHALEETPPDGLSVWDGPALSKHLNASVHAVWRVLRKEGICLQRQRSWCVSTDPEFAAKAADIIGLYLDPPLNALVFSIDEKPSMQALERKTGYITTSSGKIVRGLKSTYKRHGTLNLFAALNVFTGAIRGKITQKKRRVEFIEFMDELVAEISDNTEIHVIVDNYCIHKKNSDWLSKHPNVFFHFTPTSASWLNQVEIWFGIMSRKVLRNASFRDKEELIQAIEKFIKAYTETAKPFKWRKREVKGSQLKNTIVNLCN